MKLRHRSLLLLVVTALAVVAISLPSCRTVHPNREPLGEDFPRVSGNSLEGAPYTLPDDLAGAPAVLLLGFVQKAQFDADRWLLGLLQAGLAVRVLEVPAARGWVPAMIRGTIDSGMRSGIPQEDWGVVWTLYGEDADAVQRFTGNEGPRNVRVLLFDAQGRVRWFHDRGYSASTLLELQAALEQLARPDPLGK